MPTVENITFCELDIMEKNKGIAHKFNLTGMATGDWFLGCTKCWFQLSTKTAAKPECPNCKNRISHLTVTDEVIK